MGNREKGGNSSGNEERESVVGVANVKSGGEKESEVMMGKGGRPVEKINEESGRRKEERMKSCGESERENNGRELNEELCGEKERREREEKWL